MSSFTITTTIPCVREAASQECMRAPENIAKLMMDTAALGQEVFSVLTLDAKYRVIDRHAVSVGAVNYCLAHPREIFRPAIADNAVYVVVSHNHPSGDTTPSMEDTRLTRKLIEAGRILEIELIDHIIIGRPNEQNPKGWLSMREAGSVDFGY